SNPLEFEITKADNSFVTALTIANWTYGETPNQPVCVTRFGEAGYTYSDSIDGTYGKLPDDPHAGIWYVKAAVEGTDNYNKLISQPFEFSIIKAKPAEVNEPENLEGIYGQTLKDVKLSDGWKWVEEDTALTVVNNGYMARIKVDDINYDYSSINGYAEGYVNRTLKVTVAQVENSWIEELEIECWTYGKTQNSATAKPKFGTVKYTYTDEENNVYETMPKNAHAGIWTVKAVVEATSDYQSLEAIKTFKILKAESTITIKDDLNKIYDGSAVVPTVEKTGSSGEVTYKWYEYDESGWSEMTTAPVEAGRYRVNAILAEDINYNGKVSVAKEFIISKAASTLKLSGDLNKSYDGTAVVEPAVTKTGSTGEVTFKWYQGDKELDTAPVNVGSYSVKAYLAGDRNYDGVTSKPLSFEITKADNSFVTALTIANWTYGETPNQPVCVAQFGEIKYTYSDSIDGTYGKLLDDPHAGTWYVKAEVKGTDNYEGLVSEPVAFEINKAAASDVAEPENLEGIYGQTLKDVKLSDGWKWIEEDTALTVVNNGYMARIKVDDMNYDYSSINGYVEGYVNRTLKVTVAQVENSWIEELEIEGWTYGKIQNSAKAKAKYGTVKYTYRDEENNVYETMPENAHAGTWVAIATVEATVDYKGLEATKVFNIEKAASTIKITNDLDKIYDGNAVVPTVEKTGSSGEVNIIWYENDGSRWNVIESAPLQVGRYKVEAVLSEDINYNSVKSQAKEFIISKADSTIAVSGVLNKSYDGTAVVEPAVTKTGSTGEVTFKWYQGDKQLDQAPINAGSYSVKAYLAGDRNFNSCESNQIDFVIAKADTQLEFTNNLSKEYDGIKV
ncbi:MBG domain-containing protein, partial [Thomasclavelia sp.]